MNTISGPINAMSRALASGGAPLPARLREYLRRSLARRFALRLTIEGWCLVIAMLLIGLAALNTAAPLLYLMFSLMCAFFVFSAILATNTVRGVSIRRELPHTWIAGKPLPVRLYVRNRKLFSSSYSLRLYDYLDGGEVAGAAFADRVAPGGGENSQIYECVFLRRGVYKFNTLEVATRFPFGLIDRQLKFDETDRLLVLPQMIVVERAMLSARADLGDFDSNRKGAGSGLYGFREYTAEQSAKDIHWKVSARRGQLMVREYESEERRRATVLLDNRIPRGADPEVFAERFEMAVILAGSVIDWLVRRGHEVELRTAAGAVGFGGGLAHVTRCLRALATVKVLPMESAPRFGATSADPTVVTVPIVLGGRGVAVPGVHTVSVDDFEDDIRRVLSPPQASSPRVSKEGVE